MDHTIDLEAQQQVLSQSPEETGGSQIHGSIPPSEAKSGASGAEPVSTDQQASSKTPPAFSQASEGREAQIHETKVRQHERDNDSIHASVDAELAVPQLPVPKNQSHAAVCSPCVVADNGPDPELREVSADEEPQEIRMVGDFDGSANALWTLYGTESKSHDEARIQTLKDDMDGVLIFAGLYSAVLTSFIIDSKQNLKVNPADQMVYYLQQNTALLDQISRQISSIAPQFPVPSSPPPLYPDFSPSYPDIRVNVFWFMALVFSLSAALLATLVQQWVRDYMQAFQRYGDPLKSARLRQYLHDGCEKWYMPAVAEAVPGLLHVSLFLFFVGLGDAVLNINTAVGVSTVVPIAFCGVLYIFTTFAPILYPQSPYQNSFSGLFWYLVQRLHGRTYKDRGSDGGSKTVSPKMSEGQMQLAMEPTGERMMRDEEAIRWLTENLTEEAEMDLFVMAIPGSFNVEWGIEVWRRVSQGIEDKNKITSGNKPAEANTVNSMAVANRSSLRTTTGQDHPVLHLSNALHTSIPTSSRGENVVRELFRRVGHLLETCKNRGLFASDEQWRKRTRACVETTASLVGCANAELGWFGDIEQVLGDIGKTENTGKLMSTGMDQSFVLRWTCLSLMSIRPVLSRNVSILSFTSQVMWSLDQFGEQEGTQDEKAWKNAQKVDGDLDNAFNCLWVLFSALKGGPNLSEEEIKEILRNHESEISNLERINIEADRLTGVDFWIEWPLRQMDEITHGITQELPGFQNRIPTGPIPFTQIIDLFIDPYKFPLIVPPGRLLKSLCSLAPAFRDILKGQDIEKTREALKSLNAIERIFYRHQASRLLQRQLLRLHDLSDGSGFGVAVELFFIALKQLSSTSSSQASQSALYIGTFRAITSDWSSHKHNVGTQKILLNAISSRGGIFSYTMFPAFITNELLVLLGNMLDRQTGPHIDNAVQELRDTTKWYPGEVPKFRARALEVILKSQTAVVGRASELSLGSESNELRQHPSCYSEDSDALPPPVSASLCAIIDIHP